MNLNTLALVMFSAVATVWPGSIPEAHSDCPQLVSAEQREELPIVNPHNIDPNLLMVCDDVLTPDDIYSGLISVLVKIEDVLRNQRCDPRSFAIHEYPVTIQTLLGQLRHVSSSRMRHHPVLGTYLDTMATRTRQLIGKARNCQLDYVLLMKIIRMSMKLLVNQVMCGFVESDVLRRRLRAARTCACDSCPGHDRPFQASSSGAPIPWRRPIRDWKAVMPSHWYVPPENNPLGDKDLPWYHPHYYRHPVLSRRPDYPPQYQTPSRIDDPILRDEGPEVGHQTREPLPWNYPRDYSNPAFSPYTFPRYPIPIKIGDQTLADENPDRDSQNDKDYPRTSPPMVPQKWPFYPPQYQPVNRLLGPVRPDGSPIGDARPPVCEECEKEKNVIASNF